MKRQGASIIFVNNQNQVLLILRDDRPDIPYPNMWDVPGGHVETNETVEQCIIREMAEELGLTLTDFHLFSTWEFKDRIETVFWKKADLNINQIHLTEGQKLKWFAENEVSQTELAYGFNEIINDFFNRRGMNPDESIY